MRERAAGDARRGLARARALEHVAHVGEAELPDAGEVGVARAREMHLGHVGLDRPRVHPLLPVGVVAVGDLERDGPAERAAVADAGGDLGGVALDLHPPAAAVAELAARHVAVDRLAVELEPGGQALDDAGEAGAVALPGGDEAQRHARKPIRPAPPAPAASGSERGEAWPGLRQRDGGVRERRAERLSRAPLERARGGVPAIARGAVARDARLEQAAAGLRAGLRRDADAVLLLWILTRSSWYCPVDAPVSSVTSRNSVSPALRRSVSHSSGLGRQSPSPTAATPWSTRKTAVLPSLSTPR